MAHADHRDAGGLALSTLAALVVARLRQTESAFTSAQEIARVGLGTRPADPARALVDELPRIFGIDNNTETGPEFSTRVHPHDLPVFEGAMNAMRETCQPYSVEYRIHTMDGEERWLNCRAECHCDEHGRAARVTGVAQDITDRKLAELSSQESRQRMQLAGRLAYDLIYEWNPADDSLTWFGSVDRLLGYPKSTIGPSIVAWRRSSTRKIAVVWRNSSNAIATTPRRSRPSTGCGMQTAAIATG